jgi:hypothetical protein
MHVAKGAVMVEKILKNAAFVVDQQKADDVAVNVERAVFMD